MLGSCSIKRFLKNDEYVVRTNKIVFNAEATRRERANIGKNLLTLTRQKDLPVFVFFKSNIGAWNYFRSEELANKKGLLRSLTRTLAKKPNIFDENQSKLSAANMKQSLINAGYRNNSVTFDKLFTGKNKGYAEVSYNVNLGNLFVFDSLNFVCTDTVYQSLLDKSKNETILVRGEAMSASNYEKEKIRLIDYFNNKGYARFGDNFIAPLEADTSIVRFNEKHQRLVNATLNINLPTDSSQTHKFYIGDVSVFPNFDIRKGETIKFDTIIGTNIVRTYDGFIGIKPSLLKDLIGFKSGELFNRSAIAQTDRRLKKLGIYNPAYSLIIPKLDECDSNAVAFSIHLTRNKLMSAEFGGDFNFANVKAVGSGSLFRIGATGNIAYSHRNLFNGAERFTTSLTAGVDVGLNNTQIASNGISTDFRFDNRLNFPKVVDLNAALSIVRSFGFLSKKFKDDYKENANTEIYASLNTSNRLQLDLYRLDRYNIGLRDIFRREGAKIENYSISPTAFELNLGKITDSFRLRLEGRTRTLRSFDTTLVTGFIFRSFNYDFVTKPTLKNETYVFSIGVQQSGAEVWAYDKIFRNAQTPTQLTREINFSKFVRFDASFVYTKELTPNLTFAIKTSVGLATPFAESEAVPFSYQYLLGGPNSIRGWTLGSLGLGGFNDPKVNSSFPSQAGEFKFEINSELRFPIYSYLKGALFFDAGNIWNLNKDPESPGAELSKYWYDQLAVGSGLGLRFDFGYFTLRFDLGLKLRNPYSTDGSNWIPINNYGLTTNFAIGLPF